MIDAVSSTIKSAILTIADEKRNRHYKYMLNFEAFIGTYTIHPYLYLNAHLFNIMVIKTALAIKVTRVIYDAIHMCLIEERNLEDTIAEIFQLHIVAPFDYTIDKLDLIGLTIEGLVARFGDSFYDLQYFTCKYVSDIFLDIIQSPLMPLPFIKKVCKDFSLNHGDLGLGFKLFPLYFLCVFKIVVALGLLGPKSLLLFFITNLAAIIRDCTIGSLFSLCFTMLMIIERSLIPHDADDLLIFLKNELVSGMDQLGLHVNIFRGAIQRRVNKDSEAFQQVLMMQSGHRKLDAITYYVLKHIDAIKNNTIPPSVSLLGNMHSWLSLFFKKETQFKLSSLTALVSYPEMNSYLRELDDVTIQDKWYNNEEKAIAAIKKFPQLIIFCSVKVLNSVNQHVFTIGGEDVTCTLLGYIDRLAKRWEQGKELEIAAPALLLIAFKLREHQRIHDGFMRVLISIANSNGTDSYRMKECRKYAEKHFRDRNLIIMKRCQDKDKKPIEAT